MGKFIFIENGVKRYLPLQVMYVLFVLFFYIREIQHLKIVFWSLITIQECIIQITNYLYHTITTNNSAPKIQNHQKLMFKLKITNKWSFTMFIVLKQ